MRSLSPIRNRRAFLAPLPALVLLLQIAVAIGVLGRTGRLDPEIVPDSWSYQRISQASTAERALKQHRTYGYPLFLKMVRLSTGPPHLAQIPEFHAALWFGAVLLFWFAVADWTRSPWLALAAATPLTSAPLLSLIPRVQPDFAASALALMAMSLLLLLASRPARVLRWLLLTVVVFLTYQVRPAYVFLIPLVPLIGWALRWCRRGRPRLGHVGWAANLALAMIVPFLLFAGARKALVDHFGLVSFSGFSLIGVTASFLDEELIESLPPESHKLASTIHAGRAGRGWRPLTLEDDISTWHEQYNLNTWRISINPARRLETAYAREVSQRGKPRRFRDIEVNDRLMSLSRQVIQRRPRLYIRWVRDSFLLGAGRVARYPWVLWPFLAVLVSLPVARLRGSLANALQPRLLGLVLLCVSFTVAHLLLVAAVSAAFDRYLVAVALLLPSALCALLLSLWLPPAVRRMQ